MATPCEGARRVALIVTAIGGAHVGTCVDCEQTVLCDNEPQPDGTYLALSHDRSDLLTLFPMRGRA